MAIAIKGVDTIDRTLTGAILAAHRYIFVCRYVQNASTPNHLDKEMTAAEVREKSAAGVRIVSNWELSPVPKNSVAEGKAHARAFLERHAELNGPHWAPCYYSVDTDAGAGAFDSYAHGWADILGPDRCGCYGDGALFRDLKAKGLIRYAWQSLSRSFPGNTNHTGADIVQTGSGTVAGHSVDFNTAHVSLYGGWLLGEPDPNVEEPMALTNADAQLVARTVWGQSLGSSGPTTAVALQSTYNKTRTLGTGGTAVNLTDADLDAIATRVVDMLAERLQSTAGE